ncbi:phage tail tube protein [Nitratireductor soli]|uniref:phage tail tube protein n=1 Tax=Nitratireductor soli TaxID=1670619 RepID=UPI00065E7D58|nr:phage tail tube protein [Nitratireductor soli]
MPIKWRSKILLAKIEAAYGVDSAPTGGANAILATNIVLTPMEGQDVSRELELPWLAAQATIPAGLHVRLQFRVELVPSGAAGTAPAWGPLMRACAVAETVTPATSVVYNPVTDGHESVTIHFWIGGTRYVARGSRGTAVLRFTAQAVPYLEFDFRGLFAVPSEQARPTPTLTAFLKPDLVTSAKTPSFEIGAQPFVMRSFALDLGNAIEMRFLVGSETVLITDKAESAAAQVEAVPLSTFDPYTAAQDQTSLAVELVHGTVAGRIATLDIAAAQLQRPAGLENAQDVLEWPLRLVPLPVAGNDQWTLTLT